MRRITIWMMSTLSALVLLFSYSTSTNAKATTSIAAGAASVNGIDSAASAGTAAGGSSTSTSGSGSTDSGAAGTGAGSSSSGSSSSSSSTSTSAATATYTGDAVMTRWGVVQVQITVKDGRITKSAVVQVPWDNPTDQDINSYAVPILNKAVVAAQSASIDMVSGATVTSGGYLSSLQSAIDQAHL